MIVAWYSVRRYRDSVSAAYFHLQSHPAPVIGNNVVTAVLYNLAGQAAFNTRDSNLLDFWHLGTENLLLWYNLSVVASR